MRSKTTYEWRVNQVDEHGDINDIAFYDTYAEAANCLYLFDFQEIELTRTVGNDDEGIIQRDYATVDIKHWELPETFDGSTIKVPAAKKAEVRRWHKSDTPVICKSKETMQDLMRPFLLSGEIAVRRKDETYDSGDTHTYRWYSSTLTGVCVVFSSCFAGSSKEWPRGFYEAQIGESFAKRIFSAS